MPKTITAVFDTRDESEAALRKLEQAGFTKDHVAILVSEETRGSYLVTDESHKIKTGAEAGAAIGGLAGALYLGLATAGLFLVPGLNVVVTGAVIGGLVGLGTGAVTGGLIGALVGLGVPENEARLYEGAVRDGATLIAVETSDDASANKAKEILKGTSAKSVKSIAA